MIRVKKINVLMVAMMLGFTSVVASASTDISGSVTAINATDKTITVGQDTLPISEETLPLGLKIFESVLVGQFATAKVERDAQGNVIKTTYLEVTQPGAPL